METLIKGKSFGSEGDLDCAVLLINLDRLSMINDALGCATGDRLVTAVANRLRNCIPVYGSLARLHNDDLVVFFQDASALKVAQASAELIQQALILPFMLGDRAIFITASVGIACTPIEITHCKDLLQDAYTAMNRARALGGNRHEIFTPIIRQEAACRLQQEFELRMALMHEELRVYYQPIVKLATGKITGFEALVRWQHPKRGLTHPRDFVPLAEETGWLEQIDRWVLQQACQQLSVWLKDFSTIRCCAEAANELPVLPPLLTISVNISASHLAKPDLVEYIQQVLWMTRLKPGVLKLEITESALIQNSEAIATNLRSLTRLGIKIHMDDFGTGYSSLSQLYCFPIDALKIDQSFIQGLDASGEKLEIVQMIIKLARNLGMTAIAEGVETRQQIDKLKTLSCDFAQGYQFSQPLDAEAIADLLRSNPTFCLEMGIP